MTTSWPSFIDQVFKEDSLVESRLRRIAEKNTKKLKFIQCFCKCKCKSISNNLTCDQCQRQGTKYVWTEEGTWRLLTHPLSTLSYILKKYFCKHCQRHNGPMGWHHNWRHLITSKFSQQVAPHEFVGKSCISTKFDHQEAPLTLVRNWPPGGATCISTKFGHHVAPLALVGNLSTRWRHLH